MLCVVGWRVPYRARLVMGNADACDGGEERRGEGEKAKRGREVFFPPNTIGTNWGRRGRPNLAFPREAIRVRVACVLPDGGREGICFCLVGA